MEFVNMNEFKEKYCELMKIWINGNAVKFYINNVLINDDVDCIEFEDNEIYFGKLIDDDESFVHNIVDLDHLQSIEIFVLKDENWKTDEKELICLSIYKEQDEWKHEIILPKKSNE